MPAESESALDAFHVCTQTWFRGAFLGPTRAQRDAWPPILRGASTLLLAPTGSGKTLAAFLAALDRLAFRRYDATQSGHVRVVYVSPLKALGVDIDRNLRAPIAGLRATAERLGVRYAEPRVGIRSGDTAADERRRLQRHPPDILITTPESLYLMLTSQASESLARVETVIVDEIHVMAPTKRGAHLFLSLERLERLRRQTDPHANPLQRIGLSATQRPLDEIARLLGGADATADPTLVPTPRHVEIVDASEPKRFALRIETPVEDMARIAESARRAHAAEAASGMESMVGVDGVIAQDQVVAAGDASWGASPSIWPAIHPRLLELIRQHRSTLAFVNSRRLAERLAAAINELAGEELAMAHHGSVSKDQRLLIEDRLKRGRLPALFATSSLELGIDMGAIDLVIQIEAPPSVAAGIQRIGRSGRGVDLLSRGVIFPKYRGDLLACAAAAGEMSAGRVESTRYPRNPLDLAAQQIVACASRETLGVDAMYALLRSAAPFAELPWDAFVGLLEMLSGRYPSDRFAELRPRIVWNRVQQTIGPRKGAQRLAVLNGGTIPDRGLYGVFLAGDGADGAGGSRVGELDEEMVFETHAGDVFLLGASSWRVVDISQDRVLVTPAPGEPGKTPFWRGDRPGRPLEFGRAIGKLAREIAAMSDDAAGRCLKSSYGLDERAARNLVNYLRDQIAATGDLPSDVTLVVESFLDEIGDWRICVLSPFGTRVHAPWAMAIAGRLQADGLDEVDLHWTDEGMVFRLPETSEPPPLDRLFPPAVDVEDLVARRLGSTAHFAARFRENAARALLLPRRQPQRRTPLWLQRRKAADLLAVASDFPRFPILLETYRECLRDAFDLPGLASLLGEIERGGIRVTQVTTLAPSPFASSLLFNYVGNFIYDGDAPLAERRAQALALDYGQLRQLLGSAELRQLLDPDAIAELVNQRQRLAAPALRDADDVHDLLLALGDLTYAELSQRAAPQAVASDHVEQGAGENLSAWLASLERSCRIVCLRIAGDERFVAAEDAARFRDALGTALPAGLPVDLLEPVSDPLADLGARFARTHGPFVTSDLAQRWGLGTAPVEQTLRRLVDQGRLAEGEFLPGGTTSEWCDVEVLRTLKARSLARLRQQVEAAPVERMARFLPFWHGAVQPRRGLDAVLDAIEHLQGAPLSIGDLDAFVLPARVLDYQPAMLDELCLAGEVLWQGVEGVGPADGRIALFLTDQWPLLGRDDDDARQGEGDSADPLVEQLRQLLAEKGALRFDELAAATRQFPPDVLSALWKLVWSGSVTNDTLAPLRSRVRPSEKTSMRRPRRADRPFRSRRRLARGAEGRWSLLPSAARGDVSFTERQTALARQLAMRHGILTRSGVSRESVRGGFAAIYPVLKAMEEAGELRRGYFVAGLGGLQFAAPGADEMLRGDEERLDDRPIVLAAADPANAYGAALPWPAGREGAPRPKRIAGARVVLIKGNLAAYLSASNRDLLTFATDAKSDGENLQAVAFSLRSLVEQGTPLLLARVDGKATSASTAAEALAAAGFSETSRGWRAPRG